MTTTLCGECGNSMLACTCKPQELAKPVEEEKRHGKSCGCKQCRAIYFGLHYGIGAQKLRDYAASLVTSPVILPDILETAVYGQREKSTAIKKLEEQAEKRKKK